MFFLNLSKNVSLIGEEGSGRAARFSGCLSNHFLPLTDGSGGQLFETSGAKSGRTGRSTNPFISVQENVVVVKYILVICVVVETLSFIRVRTDGQKHELHIHKLMIICVVVETLSFTRVIYLISICGSKVYYANEILYAILLLRHF